MSIINHENNVAFGLANGHRFATLMNELDGAMAGFSMGVSFYTEGSYAEPGIHSDQEGFYVIEGQGMVKVGDQEFEISPGSTFLALPGVPHSIRKMPGCSHVKVIWCHGAI